MIITNRQFNGMGQLEGGRLGGWFGGVIDVGDDYNINETKRIKLFHVHF